MYKPCTGWRKHRKSNPAKNVTVEILESQPASGQLPQEGAPLAMIRPEVAVFATDWYLSQNPDVAEAGMNPLEHYIRHGAWEGRDPHPLFDSDWYLSQNPGVAGTGMNPLEHYLKHGAGAGRDPHPLFDSAWYSSQNTDVAASGLSPLAHYVRHGESAALPTSECIVQKIRSLMLDKSAWPPEVIPTTEEGIVISACGRFFQLLHANIRNIRQLGCDLPIDVWHLPGEFSGAQAGVIGAMANLVEADDTPFSGLSGQHTVHGFKAWMLSQSRFRKTLMLDVDSMALQNPGIVFESGRSCIMWKNGPWKYSIRKIAQLRRALELPVHPYEFESGQLFVDRGNPGVREALRLAAALNTLGWRLYGHVYGDKETYPLAFDLLNETFSIAPDSIVHPDGDEIHAQAMLQPWLDGAALFYHPLVNRKDGWWNFKEEWRALRQDAIEAEAACQ